MKEFQVRLTLHHQMQNIVEQTWIMKLLAYISPGRCNLTISWVCVWQGKWQVELIFFCRLLLRTAAGTSWNSNRVFPPLDIRDQQWVFWPVATCKPIQTCSRTAFIFHTHRELRFSVIIGSVCNVRGSVCVSAGFSISMETWWVPDDTVDGVLRRSTLWSSRA